MATKYPVGECPNRPYHLWDARKQKRIRYRYFSDSKRAHNAAMAEMRWVMKVGGVIEVIDVRPGRSKLLGQYVRRVNDLAFFDEKNAIVSLEDLELFVAGMLERREEE